MWPVDEFLVPEREVRGHGDELWRAVVPEAKDDGEQEVAFSTSPMVRVNDVSLCERRRHALAE